MDQTFKLFIVDSKPYLTLDEDVKIGDKAIVTMNDMYPTLVDCANDEQISIIQKPLTKMTKRYKVVMLPDKINLDEKTITDLKQKEGSTIVKVEDGEVKIIQ